MSRILEAEARITARDATGGIFAQIAAKLRGLEGVQKGTNDRMLAASSGLASRIGAIVGPAAIGALAVKGVTTFADFERRMARVGITADASQASVKKASDEVQQLALQVAIPADKAVDALDALVAQGRSLPEAMAFLPSVVKTAQAAGAETKDIATTAGAIGDQMAITSDRMQSAFDILVAAGKAGKFELKDMARYLPALAPLAASVGMKGEEGLRKLAATAQVVRNQTGTAEEAAGSLQNIFAKMESEETTKKFAKFGVDLRKEMAQARKEGKDLLAFFVELSDKALKGDLSKVPQLFSDMEFARGMRALLSQKGAVDELVKSLRNVDGSALKDLNRILGDTRSQIDRAKEGWDLLLRRLGEKLAPGAVQVLDALNNQLGPLPDKSPVINPQVLRSPEEVAKDGANGSTRADAARVERDAAYTNPNEARAAFLRAERSKEEFDKMQAVFPIVDRDILFYRGRAAQQGGMTPGQAIARERQIEEWIRNRESPEVLAERLPPSKRQAVMEQWNREGIGATDELLRLEAARNGGTKPTSTEILNRYLEIQTKPSQVEIKGDVQTQVEVKVTAEEGLIATIVRKVTEAVGVRAVNSNGPGSTGTTMPEAAAPRVGRGDL